VPRFTHVFVIYGGDALPQSYNGRLFGAAPLQSEIVYSEFLPEDSSFKTYDLGKAVTSDDEWFCPADIKVGPDGAIYVADFYERKSSHIDHFQGDIGKTSGRIYRVRAKDAKPIEPFDLAKKSTIELLAVLEHPNRWFRQVALRLLGDRKDRSAIPALEKKARDSNGQRALEALWALNLCGGLTDARAIELMDHSDPHVRLWSVRLKCDSRDVSPSIAEKMVRLVTSDPDVEVRSQLACSARRLPAQDGLPVLRALIARSEDADDERLPLLLWWGIESNIRRDSAAVESLFENEDFWSLPIVRKHLLERVMRRYAHAGTSRDLLVCAQLLDRSPDAEARASLLAGFEKAFKGRALPHLPDELAEALGKAGGSVILGVRRGLDDTVEEAIGMVSDREADVTLRLQLIQAFGEVHQAASVPALLQIAREEENEDLRRAALTALQRYDSVEIGAQVVKMYGELSDGARAVARTLLASRPDWTLQFLEAAEKGSLDSKDVPVDDVRKLRIHTDGRIQALVRKHWGDLVGATTEEMQEEISRLAGVVRGGQGDPYKGKKLYTKTCAKCHTLFDQGAPVGPDLTPYQRDDVEAMLVNVVNPSAAIREGFENHLVLTSDGRCVNGLLVEKNDRILVLRGADGQNIVLSTAEIERTQVSGTSMMPERLLAPYDEQEIRDLFAYLRSGQPLNE